MKKYGLFPALLLAGAAHAQTNVVKLDIFQPVVSTIALSFEHKLSEASSFQLGVAGTFGYKEDYSSFGNTNGRSTSGFAITPEYRFYLSEKHPAMEGFYVAPFLRFQYLNQTGTNYNQNNAQPYDASLTAFGLGATLGRHWIFKQRFSLDLFAGPGYTFTSLSSDQSGYTPEKGSFVGYFNGTNYDFRGGVTFGFAF